MCRIPFIFLLLLVVMAAGGGCTFTGVERTDRITDKEAERAIEKLSHTRSADTLLPRRTSAWYPFEHGRQYYVTDDHIALLLNGLDGCDPDTMHLAGRLLTVMDTTSIEGMDGRRTIAVTFSDGSHRLQYATGRTAEEVAAASEAVPLLIDMRLVAWADSLLRHRVLYTLTPLWHDPDNGRRIDGRKYVAVTVDSVTPGNKVYPLQVVFTERTTGRRAALWATAGGHGVSSARDVGALLSAVDPRLRHPDIDDATWRHITDGTVADGMTKEQCRLALGNPVRIGRQPTQGAVHEYWDYDGGTVLHFVDGLLTTELR